ncbi:hypothetical protein CYY_006525, partial [Polysphondylium violaceum]
MKQFKYDKDRVIKVLKSQARFTVQLENEIDILESLDHYNIVKIDKSSKEERCFVMEYIKGDSDAVIDKSSDVFSFKILLWELLYWRLPYGILGRDEIIYVSSDEQREKYLSLKGLPQGIQDLIRLCKRQNPQIRPSFINIQKRLTDIFLSEIPCQSGKDFWLKICSTINITKVYESIPRKTFKKSLFKCLNISKTWENV